MCLSKSCFDPWNPVIVLTKSMHMQMHTHGKHTETERQRQWSRKRMNKHSHVRTQNDRSKETLCLYLKSTVHSLVLESVVWKCRLFCSFSFTHYLIFQIVTWLLAWLDQLLQTSSEEQTKQQQKQQSWSPLQGASLFPYSPKKPKESNTAAFHNGSLLLWPNTWSLGNTVVSHVLSIAVWYCSP